MRARARQKPPGQMNKLESSYAQRLDLLAKAGEITAWRYEAITLKLAADTRYTPDFLVILPDGLIELHECKGQMLPEGRVKLRVAAASFPWFRFVIVRGERRALGMEFHVEEIPA